MMHLAYEERKHIRDDNKEEDEEESEENMKSENNDYPSSQPSPREEVAKQNRVKSAKRPKEEATGGSVVDTDGGEEPSLGDIFYRTQILWRS